MKMKQIKQFAENFIDQKDEVTWEESEFLLEFIKFLKAQNKISKCGTADGSPQMLTFPDFD